MTNQITSTGGSILKGFKSRIYPNAEQIDLLNRFFGHTRFAWNKILGQVIKAHEAWKADKTLAFPNVSQIGLVYSILPLKTEFPWLYEVSNVALQQKIRDLGSAFTGCLSKTRKKKTAYPKFKNKHGYNSIRLTAENGFRFKEGKFYIAKCETPIDVRWSRDLPSEPSSCTLSRNPSGEYYVSFVCEAPPKLTNGSGMKGFDLGLSHYLIDSDGNKLDNPRHYVSYQKKLAKLQRQHSRKVKGSKNREKSRVKVAKLHQRITNVRNDFLHKLTRSLVNENQVIGIETLRVGNMVKNHKLAKHIMDAGWSTFVRYLSYKVRESGHCILVPVEAFFPSSHLCSDCDAKLDRKLKLSERSWTCSCGANHDRDINAARNIKNQAIRTAIHFKMPGGAILHALDLE